jgi:xanthine dehydrogenase small subunit
LKTTFTEFILNDKSIRTDLSPGITVLDFVRYQKHLTGTKIGCREGDCGACTILVGELKNGNLTYRSVTSCLMPLGNAQGKHIVTIEGINSAELNPVQQAMSDEGATQCGFCTPGFVVSLAGYCLQDNKNDVIASIDGNICRCTGYKSIERAAQKIALLKHQKDKNDSPVDFSIKQKIVPEYFSEIKKRLLQLSINLNGDGEIKTNNSLFIGGGTDLYVQKHEEIINVPAHYLSSLNDMRDIVQESDRIVLGGSVTVTDMMESPVILRFFPDFLKYTKLVSSTPIRNMATIGGNFVNASPIGDFTVFFLALNAVVVLKNKNENREISLRDFYKGYKKLDKHPEELIHKIFFPIHDKGTLFNFEKVSKRTNLDIASVNSAIKISVMDTIIRDVHISAGGVGPIPMYLKNTSEFLISKKLSEEIIDDACIIAGNEITPISDARGQASYKRFLLQQLIRAHFITLFPEIRPEKFQSAYEEY